MHTASAPGRVNLIGEHLDYNGGACLPIALGYRTRVEAAPRGDGLLVLESRQDAEKVEMTTRRLEPRGNWSDFVVGVLWALDLTADGWTVVVDGDVPLGAGLSSSAALECAVALAVLDGAGSTLSPEEVVEACVRAENEYVGAPTGRLDQTVAMFAEADHALLIDFATEERRLVPWTPPGELLVIDTRAAHELSGSEYAERRAASREAAGVLDVSHLVEASLDDVDRLPDPVLRRRARHVVTENARVAAAVAAAETGNWPAFGALMTRSHRSLRDDYEVSYPELDAAVDAALGAGALGARMTGGGFGGSAIALVPPGGEEEVRSAVVAAYDRRGWEPPRFLDGSSGAAARLE